MPDSGSAENGHPNARILLVDDETDFRRAIRRQLTVRGYEVLEVDLERYKHTGELEFPRRVTVWRPQAGYRVRLGLGRPKLNKVIPSSAFEPLPRPGWRHIDLDRQPLSDVEAFGGKR